MTGYEQKTHPTNQLTNQTAASIEYTAGGSNDQVQRKVVLVRKVVAQKVAWLASVIRCYVTRVKFPPFGSCALNASRGGREVFVQHALLARKGQMTSLVHPAAVQGSLLGEHVLCPCFGTSLPLGCHILCSVVG